LLETGVTTRFVQNRTARTTPPRTGVGQQATHGPQLDALHGEAATIKARQDRGGVFYRITGRAAGDKKLAAQVQAGLANIGQRKTEQGFHAQTLEIFDPMGLSDMPPPSMAGDQGHRPKPQ
jgi:hypothetical protein